MSAKRRIALSVVHAPRALADLDSIADWNQKKYGVAHAARYVEFLVSGIASLGTDEISGGAVEERPDLRCILLRRRNRGHGHVVVFRIDRDAIRVMRLFHSAEDWQAKLD